VQVKRPEMAPPAPLLEHSTCESGMIEGMVSRIQAPVSGCFAILDLQPQGVILIQG